MTPGSGMEKNPEPRIRDLIYENLTSVFSSVVDPDPYVFRPPGSGSVSHRYGSGSFYYQAKIVGKTFISTVSVLLCDLIM
jgi:hypothetical protein